jgi:hypothetical protein
LNTLAYLRERPDHFLPIYIVYLIAMLFHQALPLSLKMFWRVLCRGHDVFEIPNLPHGLRGVMALLLEQAVLVMLAWPLLLLHPECHGVHGGHVLRLLEDMVVHVLLFLDLL